MKTHQSITVVKVQTLLKFLCTICLLFCLSPVLGQGIRIDLTPSPGLVSMVGNDRYLLTDDEEYFLLERMQNPSLLFEIKTGKLVASGAEAYKLYAKHTKMYPTYTTQATAREFTIFEGNNKLYSIKIDPYKNDVKAIKNTGIVLEYLKKKEKLYFVHPNGKRVELADKYSNKDKKDPRREVHHRSVFSNLEIGYFYITKDQQYVFDRDGRLINLLTGEAMKFDHNARHARGNVYGSYDPETSILKIDEGGDIKAYHIRTKHYLGKVYYKYYLNQQFIIPVSIPMLRSNSQLCVIGFGYAEATVSLIKDNKLAHYFINPNVIAEKTDYAARQQKWKQEEQERLQLEEAQRQWYRDNPIKGVSLITCKDCNGTGILGRTAETKANEVNVYEKRDGNYYFKGTSHDTWPIICFRCFGRGSLIK